MNDAERFLGEAARLMESIDATDGPGYGWIRYHGQQTGSSLRFLERRLADVEAEPELPQSVKLKSIRSQLEHLAGKFPMQSAPASQ
jgi:hypothetical protein